MRTMDWQAEVRWNQMQRDREMSPYRTLRFLRVALLVSGAINFALFLALAALAGAQ